METFWRDLRYSLRMLRSRPGFTCTVVITLALAIGANATIFTWIKAVLLASLPGIEQPEKLVEIWGATRNNSGLSSSYLDYLDYRDQNAVLSGLIAHQVLPLNLGRGEKPERVWGAIVSGNYFDVLGVKVLVGRTFLPEEDRTPNTHPVVVIGHGLWQRRFGADPNVLGRTITLNEHDFTVIGVAPKDFGSPFAGLALDVVSPVEALRRACRRQARRSKGIFAAFLGALVWSPIRRGRKAIGTPDREIFKAGCVYSVHDVVSLVRQPSYHLCSRTGTGEVQASRNSDDDPVART
jgi:MacB-like periplasmic core domain